MDKTRDLHLGSVFNDFPNRHWSAISQDKSAIGETMCFIHEQEIDARLLETGAFVLALLVHEVR
jgi:hypothetical protein